MRSVRIVLSLLFCVLFAVPALGGPVLERIIARNEMVVGTPGDFPPFTVATTNGRLIGMDIDLMKNLAGMMHVRIRFERMEFSRLIPALLKGEIDLAVSGMTMSTERNMQVAFVGPYILSGQSLVGKKKLLEPISDQQQLKYAALKVAALKGTTGEILADKMPLATITRTNTLDESLMLLLEGKVDALLADFPFCRVVQFRYQDRGLAMFDRPLTFEPLGIALPGDDPLFLNLMHNYLNILTGSGVLKELQEQWLNKGDWIEDLPDVEFFSRLEKGEE